MKTFGLNKKDLSWDQVSIFVLGVLSVWLSQTPALVAYACFAGIASAPGWIYAAYKANQKGTLIVSVIYLLIWIKGFFSYWIL